MLVVVDCSIVHKYDDASALEPWLLPYMFQCSVEEVLKDCSIHSAFYNLICYDFVLTDSGDQTEGVDLQFRLVPS